jgi:hypothetical protein
MGSVDDSANGVIEDRMIDWSHIRIDSLRATKESRRYRVRSRLLNFGSANTLRVMWKVLAAIPFLLTLGLYL